MDPVALLVVIFRRLPVMWQPVGRADEFPADTFFPAWDRKRFALTAHERHETADDVRARDCHRARSSPRRIRLVQSQLELHHELDPAATVVPNGLGDTRDRRLRQPAGTCDGEREQHLRAEIARPRSRRRAS